MVGTDVDSLINEPRTLGPDGQSGVFLAYQTPLGSPPRLTGYKPEEQEWTRLGANLDAWMGIDKASPPTPENLLRKTRHDGYEIPLGEHRWRVPIIRRQDDSTELPRDLLLDDAGQVQQRIKQAYASYWEASEEVARWMFGGSWDHGLTGRALQLAIDALSLNYRFSRHEQNVLQVLDSTNWELVLAASVDVPKAMHLEQLASLKKTESASTPGTESITPGSVAS